MTAAAPAARHASRHPSDQSRADATPLTIGMDGHRGQHRRRDRPAPRLDPQPAEQDVPDDALAFEGDEFDDGGAVTPESLDQIRFVLAGERLPIDLADAFVIGRDGGTDLHGEAPGVRSATSR